MNRTARTARPVRLTTRGEVVIAVVAIAAAFGVGIGTGGYALIADDNGAYQVVRLADVGE